jgi:hypothetical protein
VRHEVGMSGESRCAAGFWRSGCAKKSWPLTG